MGIKLNVKEPKGGAFEIAPEGVYIGTIYKIIDKGTQRCTYQGAVSHKRQFSFNFELVDPIDPDNRTKENKLFSTSIFSVNQSSYGTSILIGIIKAAFGVKEFKTIVEENKELDLKDLIGKSLSITITHNKESGTVYANVDKKELSSLQPGVVKPKQENESVYLSLEADEFDPAVFETLTDKMKDIIRLSPEYKTCTGETNEF